MISNTTISFALPEACRIIFEVYDVRKRNIGAGLKLALAPYAGLPSGFHQVTCDGSHLPTGIFIYCLEMRDFTASGKLVLVK